MILHEVVKDERKRRGWSLAELARRTGLSKAILVKLENQQSNPQWGTIVSIFGAFEIPVWKGILEMHRDELEEPCTCEYKAAVRMILPEARFCPYCGKKPRGDA